MTSNVTRYEKQCDEIWQAMWQALWQYCLCKGLLVKVHLFLATYFCLQWRSKYFRPKLRSKSRYTSWHLTYSVREKLLHIIWTLKWKATYIFTYIMTTKMVIFDDIWQGKIWQPFDDMWRGKMWQLFDDILQGKIWQFLAIFDKEKCENFLKIFDKEKYDNFLAIFDKEKYENLSLQLLHLVSSRDGALQAWYVERSLQHWISSDNNDPR